MKRFSQHTFQVDDLSAIPFWQKARGVDLACVGYGLLVVLLVVVSYLLGATHILPHDPHQINMDLLMAPPNTAGHLLGTDFMGRDIMVRLIIGIQAYFLPGLLAIGIALAAGTFCGVLSGYWGGTPDTITT